MNLQQPDLLLQIEIKQRNFPKLISGNHIFYSASESPTTTSSSERNQTESSPSEFPITTPSTFDRIWAEEPLWKIYFNHTFYSPRELPTTKSSSNKIKRLNLPQVNLQQQHLLLPSKSPTTTPSTSQANLQQPHFLLPSESLTTKPSTSDRNQTSKYPIMTPSTPQVNFQLPTFYFR